MTEAKEFYETIGNTLGAELSQMFGKACLKSQKKPFASFSDDDDAMVFKLTGESHRRALNLAGACLFDPSKKNRPMKEWVVVPFEHKDQWKTLALEAETYVLSLLKK